MTLPSVHPNERTSAELDSHPASPITASGLAAVWALLYALYRAYYALGGTLGMFGTPVSWEQWRFINGIGAGILLVGAAAPLILLPLWRRPALRPALLACCWLVTVGCVMHALVDIAQRLLSLAGILAMSLPFWQTIDQRQSDLQDLLFNEPWFLAEGLLWAAIARAGGLRSSPWRRWWVLSALAAILGLTVAGLLSAFDVTGRLVF